MAMGLYKSQRSRITTAGPGSSTAALVKVSGDSSGGFEAELSSYGKSSRALGPVVGAYGEMSGDVYVIAKELRLFQRRILRCLLKSPKNFGAKFFLKKKIWR